MVYEVYCGSVHCLGFEPKMLKLMRKHVQISFGAENQTVMFLWIWQLLALCSLILVTENVCVNRSPPPPDVLASELHYVK